MRILVCGGRAFKNRELIYKTLYSLADEFKLWADPDAYGNTLPLGLHIISGGAAGADSIAVDFAMINWTGFTEFKADWEQHGKAAGPMRNQQMLERGSPDLVIAFRGGRGTADMIARARKAGIEVREIV
jgi:hypothetical protein